MCQQGFLARVSEVATRGLGLAFPGVVLAVLAGVPGPAAAGPSYQVPIGPRALALGGAFGAIADDATALYWNPAGLPLLGHQEISAYHANLFGAGIDDNYASFVLPLTIRQAVGADWYHSGFEDSELGFGENRIQFAYGRRFHRLVSAGATVKVLTRNTDLDGTSVRRGSGVGLDLGALLFPRDGLRLALSAQDLTDTRLQYSDGNGSTVAYPRLLRAGVAWDPHHDLTLSFDTDDRWHAGAELRTLDLFSLRGGLQKDWGGPDGVIWSAGTGIRAGLLRFDYAIVDHPTLGSTHYFGASLEFNFNPAQVRIEKAESQDIYASLLKTYAHEPFTTLELRNLDTNPIQAKVSFFAPELMTAPSEQEVVLRPKATQDVPVTAVLSEKLVGEPGDRPVQASVSVTYQSHRLPRTERRTARFVAYGPGAIDWSAGVDQAAAFVTPLDPVVDDLARRAVRRSVAPDVSTPAHRTLARMAAIVDALAVTGLQYVPDPKNPYSRISATPRAVDTISYPRETLARLTGDCDDTTVLTASMLGNVGIGTQIVDVPGHVFLLADTGVHESRMAALGLDPDRFVVADEEVWVPIETTALAKGFGEAWRLGVEAYTSWSARGQVALVDVARASERYEPTVPSAGVGGAPAALDEHALDARLAADLDAVAEERRNYFAERYSEAGGDLNASADALLDVGRALLEGGRLEAARAKFEQALARDPESPRVLNNLGNVRAEGGELGAAARLYESAAGRDSADAGIWLNLGIVRYAAGDSTGALPPIARALDRSGGYEQACRVLGLEPGAGTERAGTARMAADEVRALLRSAVGRIPGVPARARAVKPAPRDTVPPGPRWLSRVAGGRADDGTRLQDLLYWRAR